MFGEEATVAGTYVLLQTAFRGVGARGEDSATVAKNEGTKNKVYMFICLSTISLYSNSELYTAYI